MGGTHILWLPYTPLQNRFCHAGPVSPTYYSKDTLTRHIGRETQRKTHVLIIDKRGGEMTGGGSDKLRSNDIMQIFFLIGPNVPPPPTPSYIYCLKPRFMT
jgi:hypothetical protein